jgi:hypothetical protein
MKRIFGVAILAVCFVLMARTVMAGPCAAKVFGNAYNCTIAIEGDGTTTSCIEFGSFIGSDFDMADFFALSNLGCACYSSGTAFKPKFESSANAFQCVSNAFPYVFQGKAGAKTVNGQAIFIDGTSYIYTCTKRSSGCL